MKRYFWFVSTFVVFLPAIAFASCEGAIDSQLMNVWYDSQNNRFIKETGSEPMQNFRSGAFILREKDSEETILDTVLVAGKLNFEKPSIEEGYITYSQPSAEEEPHEKPLASAQQWRTLLQKNNFVTKATVSPNEAEKTYDALHQKLLRFIETQKFVPLKPVQPCAYSLKQTASPTVFSKDTYRVVELKGKQSKILGNISDSILGDERSKTTVDPQPVCWGIDGKPMILAYRWQWECQGSGDALFYIKESN